ncbi:hypothetical protein LXA43DRAFT_1066737 [Ganoderma leucocontextum]|nr:hypothetical protein LXA43DRAFT_1066737 [Ganoderma leucocontextum]
MVEAMRGNVVWESFVDFARELLPVPHQLLDRMFTPDAMAQLTEALTNIVTDNRKRATENNRRPEEQLAFDLTEIVNEQILRRVAGEVIDHTAADSGVVPHFEMRLSMDTPDANDPGKSKVDAALFKFEFVDKLQPGRPNWPYPAAVVEFKLGDTQNDPYDDRLQHDVEASADKREAVRGQLLSYTDLNFLYQHRTAAFSFIVIGNEFRVMRWDRSGVFVSEKVNYLLDTPALVQVLLGFIVMDDEAQGFDPTATLLPNDSEDYRLMDSLADDMEKALCRPVVVVSHAEGTRLPSTVPITAAPRSPSPAGAVPLSDDAQLIPHSEDSPGETTCTVPDDGSFVFQYVLDHFRNSLQGGWPRYNLKVDDHDFLVAKPLHAPKGVVHRDSTLFVAYHKQAEKFVLLKDSWWPFYEGVLSEGQILQALNGDGVRNIPTLLHHDFVDGQVTRVSDYQWTMDRRTNKKRKADAKANTSKVDSKGKSRGMKRTRDGQEPDEEAKPLQIPHYAHSRSVFKDLCLPLTNFTSSRQLPVHVAHFDAMEKSKIIHRDISSGNIHILPTFEPSQNRDDPTALVVVWRGILANWDMSKRIAEPGEVACARQPERTATWRYMSIASLSDRFHITRTADEIESFFYVVLHNAIRFCPHNVDAKEFIDSTFITRTTQSDGGVRCPWNKMELLTEHGVLKFYGEKVVFYGQPGQPGSRNAPLNHLLSNLLKWLKARIYSQKSQQSSKGSPYVPGAGFLMSSNGDLPAKRQRVEPGPSNEAVTTGREPSASVDDDWQSEPVRPSDQTYELASRIDDYKAVRELFQGQVKRMDWPENDVVGDQWIRN